MTIKVYAGGTLGAGPFQQYKRAVEGVADIADICHAFHAKVFARTMLTVLPGASTSASDATTRLWNVAPMLADGFVTYADSDARLATYEVADHRSAVQQLAITSLRALAGERTAEELLASSSQVAQQLRGVLEETGPTWGLEIRDVEVTLLRDQPR